MPEIVKLWFESMGKPFKWPCFYQIIKFGLVILQFCKIWNGFGQRAFWAIVITLLPNYAIVTADSCPLGYLNLRGRWLIAQNGLSSNLVLLEKNDFETFRILMFQVLCPVKLDRSNCHFSFQRIKDSGVFIRKVFLSCSIC